MSDKQTIQRSKTTTKQPNRTAKFYDDILNCRLRELMDGRDAKTEDLANAVGIGSSAVRMWYTGYARPDIDKIPAICKFYEVSADWLLGLSETQSIDIELRDICKKTGLSEQALFIMMRNSNNLNHDGVPNSHASATAAEQLWLINHLIEYEETLNVLADNANLYVNIKKAADNFELPKYEVNGATEIMKKGLECFGLTFNFTTGRETADFHAFLCQKHFIDFIEGIHMPAYPLKGLGEKK